MGAGHYITGGPSPHGWSKHADFRLCPTWWAWKYVGKVDFGSNEHLGRGTLMAVALSHWRAEIGATKRTLWYRGERITDPAYFMPAHDAIDEAAQTELRGIDHATVERIRADAHRMLNVYIDQPAAVPVGHRILHVEEVVSVDIEDPTDPTVAYPFTARPDLITIGPDNRVYWWDDKVAARPDAKLVVSYSFSGQFVGANWLGPLAWPGRFGGVRLSLTKHDGTFLRPGLKPVPAMVDGFPANYSYYERERLRLVAMNLPAAAWPKAEHDQICVRRYGGPCPAIDLCAWRSQ